MVIARQIHVATQKCADAIIASGAGCVNHRGDSGLFRHFVGVTAAHEDLRDGVVMAGEQSQKWLLAHGARQIERQRIDALGSRCRKQFAVSLERREQGAPLTGQTGSASPRLADQPDVKRFVIGLQSAPKRPVRHIEHAGGLGDGLRICDHAQATLQLHDVKARVADCHGSLHGELDPQRRRSGHWMAVLIPNRQLITYLI